jgi:predicted  nucleic acid-binding Zn-ribbon protein
MREDFGGKLDNLEIETSSIINDVVAPFIEMADVRHRELVERLDRLEGQVQSNHKAIENVSTTADLLGRQLMDLSDDVSIVRKRLDKLERGLNNVTYDLTEARFMVNEEHSIYKAIRELEERVARLEEGKEKSEEAPSQNSGVGELKNLPQIIEWLQREGAKGKSE